MSRFLKFIIHLVILCAIVCALGLVLPPFFGVTTVVVDDTSNKTNLPMGSVTYAIPKKTADVYVGEPILVQEDSSLYRYEVQALDLTTGTGTVIDPSVTDGQPITVAVKDYVPKVVFTLAYVGYLQVATKSIEGLIILGLAVLFLIILFIIAELWKKDDKDDYDEDADSEPGHVKSRKELKREEKERQKRFKEEERQIKEEEKNKRKKKKKADKKVVRTGGFVDEIDADDDDYDEEDDVQEAPATIAPEVSDAHDTLKKEILAATSEDEEDAMEAIRELVEEEDEEEKPAEQDAPLDLDQVEEQAEFIDDEDAEDDYDYEDEDEEIAEIRKRAMPGYTASQLSDQAKAEGDSPEIVKDDITDVTLFDYSDLFDDDEE